MPLENEIMEYVDQLSSLDAELVRETLLNPLEFVEPGGWR
jgi:Asp-tRNA(Asn)/Glu-tRNA(Gln) amidotransferase C subunit